MRSDIERWNQKYRGGNPHPDFAPDPLLLAHAHLFDGAGTALDLACGVGHNALYLAQLGYEVLAVDGSMTGLGYCREALRGRNLRVSLVNADLEDFVLPPNFFDIVLVIRYLHRPLIARLKNAIRPGGLVIYQTFNTNYLRERPVFNKDYLLTPGELAEFFADFTSVATNDTPDVSASLSHWIGKRPDRHGRRKCRNSQEHFPADR